MKLNPAAQTSLLELATLERSLAAAAAAGAGDPGASLPEQVELDRLIAQRRRQLDAAAAAQLAVDDIDNEILRIQEDETKLRRRQRDDNLQLSAETDPARRRDLEHDRYAARSRIGDLMAELQEAHNEIHALRGNRDLANSRVEALDRKIEAATRARDEAAAAAARDRPEDRVAELKAGLPGEVVAEYERQREENEVGVAKFTGRACGGCFIVLPAADRARIAAAPADELPQCPNCGSYLVRVS